MFEDNSIPDGLERTRVGTVADILKASQSEDSKILNGLSFIDPSAGIQRSSFSTDSYAFVTGLNQEGWPKRPTPIGHLRWNLAATKGAFHPWHIDSDGYGTFVNVVAGSKWWIVARPKDGLDVDIFNTTSIWLDEEFDIDKSCETLFDVEAILLRPGSELCVHFFNFFSCNKLMLSIMPTVSCGPIHFTPFTHLNMLFAEEGIFWRLRRFKTHFQHWYTVLCANPSSPTPPIQNQG